MAQQRRARLAVLLVVAAPLGASAWFGPTAIRQARWMAESRQVLPVVLERLASHPKFVAVKAGVSTGCDVLVYGQVASESDAADLQSVLADIPFPHGVLYRVRVE